MYYPQDGNEARGKMLAQEEREIAHGENAAYWEAVEQAQKEEWLDLQMWIAEGRAEEAVFHAAEMEASPIVADGRNDCPVFQMVQWLKSDGFFKQKIAVEWHIVLGRLVAITGIGISFGMANTEAGETVMVLQIDSLKMAFTATDKVLFTDTLKSIMTAQARYKAEFA